MLSGLQLPGPARSVPAEQQDHRGAHIEPAHLRASFEVDRSGSIEIPTAYLAARARGNAPGPYRGYWMLADNEGNLFGYGPDNTVAFWVDIVVRGEVPTVPVVDFATVTPSP